MVWKALLYVIQENVDGGYDNIFCTLHRNIPNPLKSTLHFDNFTEAFYTIPNIEYHRIKLLIFSHFHLNQQPGTTVRIQPGYFEKIIS